MGKINRKKVLIIGLIFVALAATGIIVYFTVIKPKQTGNKNNEQDQTDDEITVYIDKSLQTEFYKLAEEFVDQKNYKTSDKIESVDLIIANETNKKTNFGNNDFGKNSSIFHYYQIWVVTKPWSLIANDNLKTINSISSKIDQDAISEVMDDDFTISDKPSDTPSKKGLHLGLVQELDATRITVPIDGKSVFDKERWTTPGYPYIYHIFITGQEKLVIELEEFLEEKNVEDELGYMSVLPGAEDFVSITKTGTTVAGGPGWQLCESTKGSAEYPISKVASFLKSTDLTIISNESSFVEGCTQGAGTTAFCGPPKYFANLEKMGVDIISLTGNHMADYGRTTYSDTMDLYTENKMNYFAAGKNTTEAWTPLIIETSAGKLAFVGFNKMGPGGVISTDTLAGSAYYDEALFKKAMDQAKSQADIIFVDTHLWPEYGTTPTSDQLSHSHEAIDFGADMVTGVSSHEIQSAEFYKNKPVFFGLGNFLFDQMWSLETRQGLVLKIHIYDKQIRDIEVHPTILYDYCQPRFAEGTDRDRLLNYVSNISQF